MLAGKWLTYRRKHAREAQEGERRRETSGRQTGNKASINHKCLLLFSIFQCADVSQCFRKTGDKQGTTQASIINVCSCFRCFNVPMFLNVLDVLNVLMFLNVLEVRNQPLSFSSEGGKQGVVPLSPCLTGDQPISR